MAIMRRLMRFICLSFFGISLLTDCVAVSPVLSKQHPHTQIGVASYLSHRFHGLKTASGEVYNQNKLTAAHRSYPLGTQVRVTNLKNGRRITLRINDRGPYAKGRVMDVSLRAAKELGFVRQGLTRVKIEVIDLGC